MLVKNIPGGGNSFYAYEVLVMAKNMRSISKTQKEKEILTGVFRFFSIKLLLISGLFLVSLFTFAIIVHKAVYENEQAFDNAVFRFFGSISTANVIEAMKFFTFFGSQNFLLPAYIILVGIFVIRKKFRYGLHIAIIALSSTGLMFALKQITHRHRPDLPIIHGINNYSFPSGHALSAFIFCGILIYMLWRGVLATPQKWFYSILLFLFAVTVGVSRIVLKVHYPTDVIASFCLGTVWSILSLWLMRRISRRGKQQAGSHTT